MNMHRTIVEDYLSLSRGCGIYGRYPDISVRDKWEHIPSEYKENLIKAGEEAAKEPWTQLLISDFTEFSKSGNRVRFEDKYFPRRRKLNKLIMAECVENKGRFLDDILDGIYLIMEESSWCLPPHNSYERDAAQEKLPDASRPIIDLFQAESGAELAFAEYLLRPVFERFSPFISKNINEQLEKRILGPYLNQHFWWMGNGLEPMCNWTPWITQNVLICALTRDEGYFDEKTRRSFLEKAALSCDYFLDAYGDDGGCNEGAQYYTHAGLCLFGCLELMDGALSGTGDIYHEKLIRNIGNFIVKMYVGGGYYVNFADCSALPGRRTAREFLYGLRCGDEVLTSFAAEDFRNESIYEQLLADEINLFYHCMQAFAYKDMMEYPVSSKLPEDSWFESMGLMVARDGTYTLAAKAGNNGDSHNHNDVGSFTIYKKEKPFVIDLGVGTYTQKTFSDRRYEIWTMQSQFHNVPTFLNVEKSGVGAVADHESAEDSAKSAGRSIARFELARKVSEQLGKDAESDEHNPAICMQKAGIEYGASDVNCILCTNADSGVSSLQMDIAGAYGLDFGYRRTVSLNKGENITVTDEYSGDMPYVLSIMTYEKPVVIDDSSITQKDVSYCEKHISRCAVPASDDLHKLADAGDEEEYSDVGAVTGCLKSRQEKGANTGSYNGMLCIAVGELGEIYVIGADGVKIEEYPIEDERLAIAWKHQVYRILLHSAGGRGMKLELK